MGNRTSIAFGGVLGVVALVVACKKDDPPPDKQDAPDAAATTSLDASSGGVSTLPDGAPVAGRCSDVDAGTAASSTIGGGTGGPPCNGDWGSTATSACPLRSAGFCTSDGRCATCGDCTAAPAHAGTVCSGEGMCGTPCGDAGGCASGQYCTTDGACLPLHENDGHPFSGITNEANCTAQGAIACVSGIGTLTVSTVADGSHPTGGDCFCGKSNGSACTSASECSSNICAANGRCGAALGDACAFVRATDGRTNCQNDNCDKATCTCLAACKTDDTCGNTVSGKVCDPTLGLCVLGCRGSGGNGCELGQTCSSTTAALGTCSGH